MFLDKWKKTCCEPKDVENLSGKSLEKWIDDVIADMQFCGFIFHSDSKSLQLAWVNDQRCYEYLKGENISAQIKSICGKDYLVVYNKDTNDAPHHIQNVSYLGNPVDDTTSIYGDIIILGLTNKHYLRDLTESEEDDIRESVVPVFYPDEAKNGICRPRNTIAVNSDGPYHQYLSFSW